MKKLTLGIACLMVLALGMPNANAQKMRGGIKGGLNVSNLYVDDIEDENVRLGFNVGVYSQFGTGAFAIQPEINYTQKGAETEYGGDLLNGEADFNLNYIEVPVLATFKLGDGADIHIGPYFGYLVGADFDTEGELGSLEADLDRDNFKKLDWGLAGGIALNFNAISVGVRYNYGLQEIADDEESESLLGDAKNSAGQVYVAFDLK